MAMKSQVQSKVVNAQLSLVRFFYADGLPKMKNATILSEEPLSLPISPSNPALCLSFIVSTLNLDNNLIHTTLRYLQKLNYLI